MFILSLLAMVMTPAELNAYVSVCEASADAAIAANDRATYNSTVVDYGRRGGLNTDQTQDLYATCAAYVRGISYVVDRLPEGPTI